MIFTRRHIRQTTQAVNKITTIAIKTGITTDKMERTVESISSRMLTGTFPAPAVVAVTAGRTARDLAACGESWSSVSSIESF